jgi:hypothetical protein
MSLRSLTNPHPDILHAHNIQPIARFESHVEHWPAASKLIYSITRDQRYQRVYLGSGKVCSSTFFSRGSSSMAVFGEVPILLLAMYCHVGAHHDGRCYTKTMFIPFRRAHHDLPLFDWSTVITMQLRDAIAGSAPRSEKKAYVLRPGRFL